MTNEDAVRLAEHCQRLMEDEVLARIFDEMDADLVRAFRNTPINQACEREMIHYRMRMLEELRAALRKHIEAGRVAALAMEQADQTARARRERGIAPGDPL